MRVLHALRRRSLGSCWYPQMSRPLAPAGNVRAIFRCSAARTNSNLSEFFFAAREVGVARRRLSLLTAACYRLLLFNFLPCAICCARLRAQAWELLGFFKTWHGALHGDRAPLSAYAALHIAQQPKGA
jgi:hypothetical protein